MQLLECLKLKRSIIPNGGEGVEQLEFSYTPGENRVNAVWQFLKTYGRYVSAVWFLGI